MRGDTHTATLHIRARACRASSAGARAPTPAMCTHPPRSAAPHRSTDEKRCRRGRWRRPQRRGCRREPPKGRRRRARGAREAPPDAAKAQTRPQEVVYRCLYTNRPGHSRAHQRWQDGLLIVTDGRSCGLVTEDKENVLCRGEPLREPVIDGAEIKVRSWTVHVTERVVPEGEEAAEDGPTQTTEVP